MSRYHATAVATLAMLLFSLPATAQITQRNTSFQGGGTTLSGGVFSLSGTAGVHQAGSPTAGAFSLDGGSWPGVCGGTIFPYGTGCAGSGGFVPTLAVSGCASAGDLAAFAIDHGLGGSQALFLIGFGQGAVPIGGGCLLNLLAPLPAPIGPFPLLGSGPGTGSISFVLPVLAGQSAASTIGLAFVLQAFVIDAGNPIGATATNGVALHLG